MPRPRSARWLPSPKTSERPVSCSYSSSIRPDLSKPEIGRGEPSGDIAPAAALPRPLHRVTGSDGRRRQVNYGNRRVTTALHRDGCGPVLAWNRDRGRGAGAGGAAFDRQLSARLDRVRSAANHQLDRAGLDLPAAPHAPQGDMLGAQGEADEPGLSWCERHAAEATQLLDRARHRGERIANVELD